MYIYIYIYVYILNKCISLSLSTARPPWAATPDVPPTSRVGTLQLDFAFVRFSGIEGNPLLQKEIPY